MTEQISQEPNPENLRTEIERLQGVLYEGWAGEKFDQLPPELQQEFLDVDGEAECGIDLPVAKAKLEAFIRKLEERK